MKLNPAKRYVVKCIKDTKGLANSLGEVHRHKEGNYITSKRTGTANINEADIYTKMERDSAWKWRKDGWENYYQFVTVLLETRVSEFKD